MTTDIDNSRRPLMLQLVELRSRLIWSLSAFFIAFIICFAFAKHLFNALVIPYKWAVIWAGQNVETSQLIYTAPQEFFFTQIQISFFGGVVLAFPVIAAQLYKFIAPGLYENERAAFVPFLVASPLLFLLGGALVYFAFAPMVMWFFLSMQQIPADNEVAISLMPKVSEYLSLVMTLVFAFGLVFQLPVITSLLVKAGMLTSEWLKAKRKYAIVLAFIAAGILTPPDPMSQIGLALPTLLLYEISIHCARLIERRRSDSKTRDRTP